MVQSRISVRKVLSIILLMMPGVEVKKHEVVVTKACTTEVEGAAVRRDAAGIETPKDAATKKPRKLVKDEHRDTGGVKWRIYKSYLKAS